MNQCEGVWYIGATIMGVESIMIALIPKKSEPYFTVLQIYKQKTGRH